MKEEVQQNKEEDKIILAVQSIDYYKYYYIHTYTHTGLHDRPGNLDEFFICIIYSFIFRHFYWFYS